MYHILIPYKKNIEMKSLEKMHLNVNGEPKT